MIKAVIFDIDNTMYSYNDGNKKAMEALLSYGKDVWGLEREEILRVLEKSQEVVKTRLGHDCAAVHNRLIRYQIFLELLDKPMFPYALEMYHKYWDTLIENALPEPGLLELLMELKNREIRIGVGSDMTAYIQYRKLKVLGVAPYIDFIVTSEEAGVEKPDPHFFQCCVQKAKSENKECLFVGDHYEKDVAGALNSGLQAAWYCPLWNHKKETKKVYGHTIESFKELKKWIENGWEKEKGRGL
ncbi:MAG: HAD family hydrolase [Lachnospiraceae bacterium]|jgi:putative hydrolase of the HAD superfamily|nr:HAD family hydrolase [Lachnospiraceae bacterium]